VKEFGLDENKIWLTSPSFFANITGGAKPKTMNDIYWKEHIDKIVRRRRLPAVKICAKKILLY
jgi:hypothetical protein